MEVRGLIGVGFSGLDYTDAVVGEVVVHVGDVGLRHVASGAVFAGYRACGPGMSSGFLCAWGVDVAA